MVKEEKIAVPFPVYMELQIEEILGAYNMWMTGEKINRSPTPEDAAMNYILNGGPENFAKRYTHNVPKIILCIACITYTVRRTLVPKFTGPVCRSFSF